MFDIHEYTDAELYAILDMNNPSDRELEAKLLSMIHKYRTIGNEQGMQLSQFFVDMYNRFFEDTTEDTTEDEPRVEGLENKAPPAPAPPAAAVSGNPTPPNISLTRSMEYSKDKLNPLLKETTKRVISIDSQYRDNKNVTNTTDFTFNLSEPLKDVVSLKLYSVQIPYTWYTVNNSYGGNFFYIKGVSPGINNNNENYSYQFQITPGNYTPESLTSKINESIAKVASLRTDVSFGQTSVIYNDGQSSSNGGSGIAKINVDITQVFNEAYYKLRFPIATSTSENRGASLASFLGYNATEYGIGSVVSAVHSHKSTDGQFNSPITNIVMSANDLSFSIVSYSGTTPDIKYDNVDKSQIKVHKTFTVFIPLTDKLNTVNALTAAIDTSLKQNTNFDSNYTGFRVVDIGNTCNFVLSVKLNKLVAPVIKDTKLAVVFSDGTNHFFYQKSSQFKFPSLIGEFSEIQSEVELKQSTYTLTGSNQLQFTCDVPGYINTLNDCSFQLVNGIYSLDQYLAAINNKFQASTTILNPASSIQLNSNKLFLNIALSKSFNNSYYQISTSGDKILTKMFGLTTSLQDVSGTYNNSTYQFTTVSFDARDTLIIKPKPGLGIDNVSTTTFTVPFINNTTYDTVDVLLAYMNSVLANYTTSTNKYPLRTSYVDYSATTGFTLHMDILLSFTQLDYKLTMYSDMPLNSWDELLAFKSSVVTNAGKNITFTINTDSSYNNPFSTIQNKTPLYPNTITMYDGSNNYFDVIPYDTTDALNPPTRDYDMRITIPAGAYTSSDMIDKINELFASSAFAKGSYISTFNAPSLAGQYINFRFNINKLFQTDDYQVVFYDPISFVSCYSGATRRGNTAITNATWDTTIGWLLGFRNQIIYLLSDYPGESTSSNIRTLTGDTAVNTNLYNYFLIILDDYVQNHLNDGLVTITTQQTNITPGSYVYVCDPITNVQVARPADYLSKVPPYTAKQLYSFNQRVLSQKAIDKSYSNGPFVKDIFGIVPMKVSGMPIGSVYVEFGGTLQIQERVYFGPVNIHRMTIRLLNDRGDLVDLNNANWSFSLLCEQLYKSNA